MKKSVLIAAGAIAFDLGMMVVSAHAAASDDATATLKSQLPPAQAKIKAQDSAVQTKLDSHSIKWNLVKDGKTVGVVGSEDACKTAGGKLGVQSLSSGASQKVCVLPGKAVAK